MQRPTIALLISIILIVFVGFAYFVYTNLRDASKQMEEASKKKTIHAT